MITKCKELLDPLPSLRELASGDNVVRLVCDHMVDNTRDVWVVKKRDHHCSGHEEPETIIFYNFEDARMFLAMNYTERRFNMELSEPEYYFDELEEERRSEGAEGYPGGIQAWLRDNVAAMETEIQEYINDFTIPNSYNECFEDGTYAWMRNVKMGFEATVLSEMPVTDEEEEIIGP